VRRVGTPQHFPDLSPLDANMGLTGPCLHKQVVLPCYLPPGLQKNQPVGWKGKETIGVKRKER